jgi:hypothetical protein
MNKVLIIILFACCVSCHQKKSTNNLYDREKELIEFLKINHNHVFKESLFALLIYRKSNRCGDTVKTDILDSLYNIQNEYQTENLHILIDDHYTESVFKNYKHIEDSHFLFSDSYVLERNGIRITPHVFVIKNEEIVFWKRYEN